MDYSAMLKEFEYRVRLKMINLYHKTDVASWDKFQTYKFAIMYDYPGALASDTWEAYKSAIGYKAFGWRATAEAYEDLYRTLLDIEKEARTKECDFNEKD